MEVLLTNKKELEKILAEYKRYPDQIRGRYYKACNDALVAHQLLEDKYSLKGAIMCPIGEE